MHHKNLTEEDKMNSSQKHNYYHREEDSSDANMPFSKGINSCTFSIYIYLIAHSNISKWSAFFGIPYNIIPTTDIMYYWNSPNSEMYTLYSSILTFLIELKFDMIPIAGNRESIFIPCK